MTMKKPKAMTTIKRYETLHRFLPVSAVLVLMTLGGCASRSTYVAFADSGVAFNNAMLQVSASSRRLTMDRESELLLSQMPGRSPAQRRANLERADNSDQLAVEALNQLDQSSRLMKSYFDALKSLASTNAPQQVGEELNTAATNLTNFVNAVGSGEGAGISAAAPVVSGLGSGFAGFAVDAALKRELNSRADVLERAFDLQEFALDELVSTVEENVDIIADKRQVRMVRAPYVSGRLTSTGVQNAWIESRADLALLPNKVDAISDAKKQMDTMRENFVKLRDGKITAAELDSFTSQLATFVSHIQAL
jgi:hypothetical protein